MKTVGRTQFTDTPWWKRIPTIDDIKYEPVNWLVEPFIPIRTLVLLVGEPGTYKSWLALDLARAVATGSQFAHMKTGPAKEVLYVDMKTARISLPIGSTCCASVTSQISATGGDG